MIRPLPAAVIAAGLSIGLGLGTAAALPTLAVFAGWALVGLAGCAGLALIADRWLAYRYRCFTAALDADTARYALRLAASAERDRLLAGYVVHAGAGQPGRVLARMTDWEG